MAPIIAESASPRDILSRLAQRAQEAHIHPTRTLAEVASKVLPRQATTTVVAEDGGGSNAKTLTGGAIAGIVIGSIAGFLLILWLIRSCTNLGQPKGWGDRFEPDHEKPVTRSPRHSYPYHHETHLDGDVYRSQSRGHSRAHSRHSHSHSHSHSPRRSVEVRPVYTYESRPRGRSPRAPPPVYTTRDLRKSSGSRRSRH